MQSGKSVNQVQSTPYEQYVPKEIKEVLSEIRNGLLGDSKRFDWIQHVISNNNDLNLICVDFESYLATQSKIDLAFQYRDEWTKKSLCSALRVAGFSSDRTAEQYNHMVW